MKLDSIVIEEAAGAHESLALALQAVAAAEGSALKYDDICAVLGLSFTAVSTTVLKTPGWWMTYGRDAFLEPGARLLGFRVRELHPPDVGVDMLAADEFPQHFEISYKPLIRRALENGQPVLAWHGWPDDAWAFWGVITTMVGDELEGVVPWTHGQRQPLVHPALQCYVVEEFVPADTPEGHLFQAAMRHGEAYINRAPYAANDLRIGAPSIVTGPAAYDAWEHWLEDLDDASAGEVRYEHRQHADFVAAGRESAMRFFEEHRWAAGGDGQPHVDAAIRACRDVIDRLAESRDVDRVREAFGSRDGRARLLADVHAAEAADRRLGIQLEGLV